MQLHPLGGGVLYRLFTCVILIDADHLDGLTRDRLQLLGQSADLGSILLVCGGGAQGQEVPQGFYHQKHVVALLAFGPVVARPTSAFRGGLQRQTVQNGGGRFGIASLFQAEELAPVVHRAFNHIGFHPALGLIVPGVPGREIVRHRAPRSARANQPAQRIEDLPQRVLALRSVFRHRSTSLG